MAMNFPDSPSVDDTFTVGDQTWKWTGTTWDTVPLTEYSPSPHAATHELGGSDPLELDPTQVTGLDELNTGTAGYTALSNGTAGLSYQPVSHNYIINGAMEIDQRGTAFPSVGNDEYTLDRWAVKFVDSVDKSTDTPSNDFAFSSKVTTGTNTFPDFYQKIEAENAAFLYGKDFTISFWIKANQSLVDLDTARVQFYTADSKNDFSSQTIFGSYFFNADLVANTWVKVEGTVLAGDVPTSIVNGLRINIRTATNTAPATSGEFYITGVQLEAGSIATPFKRNANSIQGELAACQRFFRKSYNQADAPGTATRAGDIKGSNYTALTTGQLSATVQFDQPMRGNPTVKVYDDLGVVDQVTRRQIGVTVQRLAVSQSLDIGETGFTITSDSGNSAGLIEFHYTAEDEL